jgi:hypothetical protein
MIFCMLVARNMDFVAQLFYTMHQNGGSMTAILRKTIRFVIPAAILPAEMVLISLPLISNMHTTTLPAAAIGNEKAVEWVKGFGLAIMRNRHRIRF